MIGAGAVVTKNVKDFELLVGNPARQIGWVSERGNKLQFDENGIALCIETSSKYLLKDGKVIKIN
jgi:UDP-2-acetamido-3-amino-2,3-dideoxy-glucuronate N-acetyltransferase